MIFLQVEDDHMFAGPLNTQWFSFDFKNGHMSAGLIEHIFSCKFAACYRKEFRNINYKVIRLTFF